MAVQGTVTEEPRENDWNQYATLSPLDREGGALYRQSILTNDELQTIQLEAGSMMTRLNEEQSPIAQNRLGASLEPTSETVAILAKGSLCKMVQTPFTPGIPT